MKLKAFVILALILALFTATSALAVDIELINHKREAVATFEAMIAAFEAENPDINVELNTPSDATTVLHTRAASGSMPDLWTVVPSEAHYKEYHKAGYNMDLTDMPFMANVNEPILELVRLDDGRIYAAPTALNTFGVYYSEKVFEELNLTVPNTYDEFIALLETVKAADITPIIFPDMDAWTVEHFFCFTSGVWTPNFMEVYDACRKGESHIKDDAGVRINAQRLIDLRYNYGQGDTLGTSYDNAINDFANGKAAMFIQGSWASPSIKAANPDFKYSMFPIPADKAEDNRVMAGVDCAINVRADGENVEAALKFVEFLMTPENAQKYSEMDRSPSAVKNGSVDLGEINALVEYLNAGKSFPQLLNLTTAEIAANEADLCQGLVVDGDVDLFLEEMDTLWFNALNR